MHWERLSEDVYVFTSDRYAQVTASLIVSGTIGVVIDTLPFPNETSQIALFARRRCADGVRYVVYTQHQSDHTYGAFLFPRADIVSHALCREILMERGFKSLEQTKAVNRELEPVRLRIPNITFDQGTFTLRLPGKTLDLIPTPGHTVDSISVLLQEEKILFAGDTIMAIPTLTEGDPLTLRQSIENMAAISLESIVQGHGEIILRGEIKDNVKRSLAYIDHLTSKLHKLVEAGGSLEEARKITIDSCGLQRVLLNGMVTQLHTANVISLYNRMVAERGPMKPIVLTTKMEEKPAAFAVVVEPEDVDEDADADEPDIDEEIEPETKPARKRAARKTTRVATKRAKTAATATKTRKGKKPGRKPAAKKGRVTKRRGQ